MSVLPSQFDASKLAFGEVRALSSGAKAVNLTYGGGPLVLQLSNVDLPYGLNADDKFGPVKYSVNFSLNGYDSKPKMTEIYNALQSLDDRVTSECVQKNWLRKPGMTQDILKQMKLYKPTVKFSEDSNTGARKPYPPTVKASLRQRNDKFETAFYDTDRTLIKDVPIEDLIVKRMTVMALIECTSVWISSVGCGLSWKVTQLKVVSRPDSIRGYGFIEEGDAAPSRGGGAAAPSGGKGSFAAAFDEEDAEVDEDSVLKSQAPPPKGKAQPPSQPQEQGEGDEEEEAADEAVAAAAAAPVPKRTVVKKKVVAKAA
jgi:hypothetical protein